jgi:hypothetical protein
MTTPHDHLHAHSPDHERLLQMLMEDIGDEHEVEALLPTVVQLKKWSSPPIDLAHKAALIQLIREHQAVQGASIRQRIAEWRPYLLLRAQVRIVQRDIWLASAFVILLGFLVTLTTYRTALSAELSDVMLPLVLMAPISAAIGMAMLYNDQLELVLELERGTRTSLRLIMLARMTLVFGFDFLIALAASLMLSAVYIELGLWSLVLDWLAPMAFLSGLAFLLSVWSKESAAGIAISLALWFVLVFRRVGLPILAFVPNLAAPGHTGLLLMLAIGFGVIALWLAGNEDRLGRVS